MKEATASSKADLALPAVPAVPAPAAPAPAPPKILDIPCENCAPLPATDFPRLSKKLPLPEGPNVSAPA